jgi:hypothetical protein
MSAGFSLQRARELSRTYGINVEDIVCMALNAYGVDSTFNHPRMRFLLRLRERPETLLKFIVPLGRKSSPFFLTGECVTLNGEPIADIMELADDDISVSYFRRQGQTITFNSNARSHCVGCVFCYTALEVSSDPRITEAEDLENFVSLLQNERQLDDLSSVKQITLSTGCFQAEGPALNHLQLLRRIFGQRGFQGRISLLSSVLTTDEAFDRIVETVAPFQLVLTVECFTNRSVVLKRSKAERLNGNAPEVLKKAYERGLDTTFTYIAGLDPFDDAMTNLEKMKGHLTEFPTFQTYQAHNAFAKSFAAPGTDDIEWYLRFRKRVEEMFADTGLRPLYWANYRPLWYFTFANEQLRPSW